MDWDKLKIFYTVAEASSFTKAATILNLSQSAISRQIQSLAYGHKFYILFKILHEIDDTCRQSIVRFACFYRHFHLKKCVCERSFFQKIKKSFKLLVLFGSE